MEQKNERKEGKGGRGPGRFGKTSLSGKDGSRCEVSISGVVEISLGRSDLQLLNNHR